MFVVWEGDDRVNLPNLSILYVNMTQAIISPAALKTDRCNVPLRSYHGTINWMVLKRSFLKQLKL